MLAALLGVAEKVIDKVFPDPVKKAEAMLRLKELEQSGDLAVIAAQMEVNKVEAAHPNIFVSGWRPFIGWVCGSALAIQLVVGPMLVWGSRLAGKPVDMVVMDVSLLTTMLVGMLGLGGMRTVEKLQGVASK